MYAADIQKSYFDLSKQMLEKSTSKVDLETLRTLIVFHEWKYYVDNSPLLSDFEYDQLFKKLQKTESDFPDLISADSPTQRVSQDLTDEFLKVKHLTPMLSLGNSYNLEDIQDFETSVKKLTGETDIAFAVEPKFDGGSIALVYENDYLIQGATRGDGNYGELMTSNAKSIRSIPLKAEFSKFGIYKAELRGEAVIRKDIFAKVNQEREENQQVLFANPRNAATGGLRMKDPNETAKRGIDVFIFQLSYAVDKNGNDVMNQVGSHSAAIKMLGNLGFKIPNNTFGVY